MFDLMALAFQADITRVITFSMDREASMRTYTNLGIAEAFHPLSHHGNNPQKQDKLVQIQRTTPRCSRSSSSGWRRRKEGDGTVLDHSTILFGSNMSNSDRHNNDPLPAAILGHAHGRIKGGQHLKYPQDSRFADLLLTLFDRNNIPVEKHRRQRRHPLGGLDMRTPLEIGAGRRPSRCACVAASLPSPVATAAETDAARRGRARRSRGGAAAAGQRRQPERRRRRTARTAIMWAACERRSRTGPRADQGRRRTSS